MPAYATVFKSPDCCFFFFSALHPAFDAFLMAALVSVSLTGYARICSVWFLFFQSINQSITYPCHLYTSTESPWLAGLDFSMYSAVRAASSGRRQWAPPLHQQQQHIVIATHTNHHHNNQHLHPPTSPTSYHSSQTTPPVYTHSLVQ